MLRYGILGPPVLWRADGHPRQASVEATVELAGRDRAVLSALLLRPNRVVTMAELIDAVWAHDPPSSARGQVHGCMFRLRRILPDDVLRTNPSGYLLRVGDDELDASVFERTLARGRDAVARGRLDDARPLLRRSLDLWRGPALATVNSQSARAEAARLDELRSTAWEEYVEVELRSGAERDIVGELTALVATYPLRERLRQQLMLALYRAGRPSDALEAYHQARKDLAEHLGVEPGPELTDLHRRMLVRDPGLDVHQSSIVVDVPDHVAAQLPLDVRGFAGRQAEIARLDAILAEAEAHPTAVVIAAITGTAGVGKTTLAVHWAHRVRAQFPDGQLYANLRGYDPSGSALRPDDVVRGFLDGLGVRPERVPPDLEARAGLYRSLLTGRRVLVVLDNVRDVDQVTHLLPGSPGCLVLVTSREQLGPLLAGQGAYAVPLGLMSGAEADELIAQRIGPDRVAAEPLAASDIARACARLPIALAIAAARAAAHPDFPLAALADELRDLDAWEFMDAAAGLRATFSWSYRTLSAPAAHLFRLLGLHSGPHVTVAAAASLVGRPVASVRPLLAELARANLVTEHAPGRFGRHDLLRAYAAELVRAEPSEQLWAARKRLLDHYLNTASAADAVLDPQRVPVPMTPPGPDVSVTTVDGPAAAYAWFTAEQSMLASAVALAVDAGLDAHAWRLAWVQADFLYWRGHWRDLTVTHEAALAAARRLDDALGQVHAHRGLAGAETALGRHESAHEHLRRALHLVRDSGSRADEAHIHRNLAQVLEGLGRYAEALGHSRRAHQLYGAIGNETGQARAASAIGWLHALLGDHRLAVADLERALGRLQHLGDTQGLAEACNRLGYAHHHLGDHADALTCFTRSVALAREIGDRGLEMTALEHLGDAQHAAGDRTAAEDAWRRALAIHDELGDPGAARLRAKLGGP